MPNWKKIPKNTGYVSSNNVSRQKSDPGNTEEQIAGASLTTGPKHIHIPEILTGSDILFEILFLFYVLLCLMLQYINLYKTVWWLPHSSAKYALNIDLIDPHLTTLIIGVLSRRFVFVLFQSFGNSFKGAAKLTLFLLKGVVLLVVGTTLILSAYSIVVEHSPYYALFFIYPLFIYMLLFGLDLKPFFTGPSKKEDPVHMCSTSPESIRQEVEILKTDFNHRIKHVLFNSILVTYMTALIPICFTQNTLYYDTWWVAQHVLMTWVGAFLPLCLHALSPSYLDTLHRCALNLGKWTKVENRNPHMPYSSWSELQIWQKGSLVKHVRGLFKAEGCNNSAEPANTTHQRFYFLFEKPLRVLHWLLIFTWCAILYQIVQLIQSSEWSQIIGLSFMLASNYIPLFRLMRDRHLLSKAYKDQASSPLRLRSS